MIVEDAFRAGNEDVEIVVFKKKNDEKSDKDTILEAIKLLEDFA